MTPTKRTKVWKSVQPRLFTFLILNFMNSNELKYKLLSLKRKTNSKYLKVFAFFMKGIFKL